MLFMVVLLTAGVWLAKVCRSLRLLFTSFLTLFSWELRFWLAAYAQRTPALMNKQHKPYQARKGKMGP